MGFNPISWITSGVIEGAGKVATDVGKTFFGDKTEQEKHISDEQLATLNQYAAEFVARQQRTGWDSFVDGLNRLIRPSIAIAAQASFVWVYFDPVGFAECMQALQLVPDYLWILWGTIISFYYGGRIIEKAPLTWKVQPKAIELAKEIAAERTERARADTAEKAAAAAATVASAAETAAATAAAAAVIAANKDIEVAEKRLEVEKERQATAEKDCGTVVAQPKALDNSIDPVRAMAATIWGEARGEDLEGKIAVGCVIRNRVNDPGWWGSNWEGVCTAPKQFTCWHDKQSQRVRTVDESDAKFVECLNIAESIFSGSQPDITGGADHYHTKAVHPSWSRGVEPVTVIGAHQFFRLGRDAGSYRD